MKTLIGTTIQSRRKALRVTQLQLAGLAGISVNTLYKIERGQANPTLAILSKIADTLGMEVCLRIRDLEKGSNAAG